MSFTNPGVDRRFRQGHVYDLDDSALAALAVPIERGRLVPVDERGRPFPATTSTSTGEPSDPAGSGGTDDGDVGAEAADPGSAPRPEFNADDLDVGALPGPPVSDLDDLPGRVA